MLFQKCAVSSVLLYFIFFFMFKCFLGFFLKISTFTADHSSKHLNTGQCWYCRWDNSTVPYSHFQRRTSKKSQLWVFSLSGQSSNALGKQWALFRNLSRSSPLPPLWRLHIKLCGCWSNPLLCQSSCSALAWKHSETACFHFSRGKAGLCFKSPAPPDVPWSREVDYALCVL